MFSAFQHKIKSSANRRLDTYFLFWTQIVDPIFNLYSIECKEEEELTLLFKESLYYI